MLAHLEVQAAVRLARLVVQEHVSFLWRPIAFVDIAPDAGCDYIFPTVAATARARYNVVESQLVAGITAILTRVSVPVQDISAGEGNFFVRNPDVMPQPNHRWQG